MNKKKSKSIGLVSAIECVWCWHVYKVCVCVCAWMRCKYSICASCENRPASQMICQTISWMFDALTRTWNIKQPSKEARQVCLEESKKCSESNNFLFLAHFFRKLWNVQKPFQHFQWYSQNSTQQSNFRSTFYFRHDNMHGIGKSNGIFFSSMLLYCLCAYDAM